MLKTIVYKWADGTRSVWCNVPRDYKLIVPDRCRDLFSIVTEVDQASGAVIRTHRGEAEYQLPSVPKTAA